MPLQAGTNFRVYEDVCSARSCTQKSCTHVIVVHWSKNITKNAPLPGCIQNTDKNQPCLMSAIATFNSYFLE